MLVLPKLWSETWLKSEPFTQLFALQGQIFRQQKNRRTLRFIRDGKAYFIKIHFGVGWWEIIKNLLQGRLPILGAKNEWQAIQRLEQLDIPTMRLVAYGSRGWNPATQQSFVITEELINTVSLEQFCQPWLEQPPVFMLKHNLMRQIAKIARTLHEHGVNHRDFYLCHFLLDLAKGMPINEPMLYLIDLHRVQIRHITPRRWIIKDISGLYFSALDIGLTKRDIWRFIKLYTQQSLRIELTSNRRFWQAVQQRARQLYYKTHHRWPSLLFSQDR